MTTENMWGKIPNVDKEETPVTVLKKQGNILANNTVGKLHGKVTFHQRPYHSSPGFQVDFDIIANELDKYTVTIITINYDIHQTSFEIFDHTDRNGNSVVVQDMEALKAEIRRILSAEAVAKIIQSLLLQIKSIA